MYHQGLHGHPLASSSRQHRRDRVQWVDLARQLALQQRRDSSYLRLSITQSARLVLVLVLAPGLVLMLAPGLVLVLVSVLVLAPGLALVLAL